MKLLLLLCLVAVTLALDYDYDDYEYDERNTKPKSSRKKNKEVEEYDYYDDNYDYKDDGKKANDGKYDDYYDDDYESDKEQRSVRSRKRSNRYIDDDEDYYDDYEAPKKRRNRKKSRKSAVRNFRKYGRSGHLTSDYDDYSEDNYADQYDYDNDYDTLKDDYEMDGNSYFPTPRRSSGSGAYGRSGRGQRGSMAYAARSSSKYKKPVTKYVPVVVKKKQKKKKTKIISVTKGFYIPGGTQLYGKFNDLHSCQKACELSATCFQGDYNPWLKKCYGHGNITACTNKKTHDQLIHFSKVPCEVVETPRGLVTLGARAFKGVEMKGIDSLQKCIKKCANMGGGIAAQNTAASVAAKPQICFAVDYDFETHKCFIHTNFAMCANFAAAVTPSLLVKAPANVNVLLCPIAMGK